MVRANDYPSEDDVIMIDWHHAGFFDNPAASARAAFLGASPAPDTYFDGIDNVLGAGDSVAAYGQYITRINAHFADPARFLMYDGIFDHDVGAGTCNVAFTAEVAPGDTLNNLDRFLQCSAYENGLLACCEPHTNNVLWNHIGRALSGSVPITIQNSGEIQFYSSSFNVDPGWNLSNLHVVGFISRNGGRVNQAVNLEEGHAVTVAPTSALTAGSNTTQEYDAIATYEGVITSDVTVTLDKSALPAGWDAEIVIGATTYPSSATISSMAQNDTQPFTVRIIPTGPAGLGTVGVDVSPAGSLGRGESLSLALFYNTAAILFVDDDQGAAYETEFTNALTAAGEFYLLTENLPFTLEDLAGVDVVIWNTGFSQSQTIGPNLQDNLIDYLDGGGRLFLSSHGYLNHQGTGPVFSSDYLGVTSFSQEAQAPSVTGVGGDPIGDGLNITMDYPGGFVDFADAITGIGANTTVWLNGANGDVGVRTDDGIFRTVFMSAAFEGIPAADEALVMGRIIDWLKAGTGLGIETVPAATPLRLSLSQNTPNPFRGTTEVRFGIPHSGLVSLSVFNVAGRKVVDLVSRSMEAGAYSVGWDGRDGAGSRVADGVYFYRLQSAGESLTKEMVHLR